VTIDLAATVDASGVPVPAGHRLVSLAEDPALADRISEHNGAVWPQFLLKAENPADRLWRYLDGPFADYQAVLLAGDRRIVAALNSAPIRWDGTVDGLLYGNPKQLWIQFVAVAVTWILGFVMTVVILKVLDAVMGLRVSAEDEMAGLDLSQHSETAYMLGGSASYGEYSWGGSTGGFEGMKPAEAKPRPSH